MIVIKVQGGLGNQLLQYSFGEALRILHTKEVAYDLSFFETDTKYTSRPYLLDNFNVTVRVATQEEIIHAKYPHGIFSQGVSFFRRALNKYVFDTYYVGYTKSLIPMLIQKNTYYLEGFWQSYKYYEECLSELSRQISLKDTSAVETFKQKVDFDAKVSVSVHIRRGDFLKKNAGTKSLDIDYYKKAIPLLEASVPNPTYFVFSDDIEWVKNEMGGLFKDVVYASSYGLKDYEEFTLMKECHHAVLSNSTFAWYSTLLTNNPAKVVIYSTDWKNPYLNGDSNICPSSWKGI